MSGISTCRGGPSAPSAEAPPGFRPSVRPSSLQPPPSRPPNPKNSNRESLRLEIHVTQTKQTPHLRSNRENNAVSSFQRDHPSQSISNRESLRLETDVTRTKQTIATRPNREKEAVSQQRMRGVANGFAGGWVYYTPGLALGFGSASTGTNRRRHRNSQTQCHGGRVVNPLPYEGKGKPNSNRESLRLETGVTRTKQSLPTHSNREKEALFSTAGGAERRAGMKARPYDGHGGRNSNRERKTSARKPAGELEKHKIVTPIFVSIKNYPDPLFCWSYE
jgi:hypothetical protein